MLTKKLINLIFIGLVLLIIAGCTSDEKTVDKTKKDKEPRKEEKVEFEVPVAATNIEGILTEGPGEITADYAASSKEELNQAVATAIDELPANLTEEEIYNWLIANFAIGYQPGVELYENYDPQFIKLPSSEDGAPEETNIAILLDSSGSMAGRVSDGMKMDLAKEAIKRFAGKVPEYTNIMLRVYGHKGSNNDKDKALSCKSSEVVFPLQPFDESTFVDSLGKFKPTGWTPIAASIKAVQQDFKGQTGEIFRNIVYVVSDGVETCEGDPVKEAMVLHESEIGAVVNIIGFNVDDQGQQQLKKAAEAGGGVYKTVNSKVELNNFFDEMMKDAWRGIEVNMASVMTGIKINNAFGDKMDEVRDISSEFIDAINSEEGVIYDVLSELDVKDKITQEVVEAVRSLVENRSELLRQYNEEQFDKITELTVEEKDRMHELLEKQRQEKLAES